MLQVFSEVTKSLGDLKDSVLDAVITPRDTLKSAIKSADGAVSKLIGTISNAQTTATQLIVNEVIGYQRGFAAGGSSCFAFSIVATLAGAVGALMLLRYPTKKASLRVAHSSFCASWIYVIFGCALGGLLFVPGYILSDACEVVYDFGAAPRPYLSTFGEGDSNVVADVLEGCLLLPPSPLVKSLGIADNFADVTAIDFDELDDLNVASDLDLAPFSAIETAADSVSWRDFGIEAIVNSAAQATANATVNARLDDIRTKASVIVTEATELKTALSAIADALADVEGLLKPIFDAIKDLDKAGDCSSLRARFWGLHNATCVVTLSAVLWLAITLAGGGLISIVLGSLLLMIGKQILLAMAHVDFEAQLEGSGKPTASA